MPRIEPNLGPFGAKRELNPFALCPSHEKPTLIEKISIFELGNIEDSFRIFAAKFGDLVCPGNWDWNLSRGAKSNLVGI